MDRLYTERFYSWLMSERKCDCFDEWGHFSLTQDTQSLTGQNCDVVVVFFNNHGAFGHIYMTLTDNVLVKQWLAKRLLGFLPRANALPGSGASSLRVPWRWPLKGKTEQESETWRLRTIRGNSARKSLYTTRSRQRRRRRLRRWWRTWASRGQPG